MDPFKKTLLIGSSLIGGSFALFLLAAYFMAGALASASQEIIGDRTTAAERTYAIENLAVLKQQAPQAEEAGSKITTLLPTQDGLLGFPEFMERTARVHNVGLAFSFSGPPVPAEGSKEPGYVPFQISVDGQADDIVSFVKDIETASTRFLVNFDSLTLSANASAYRADAGGKVYFQ